MENGGWFSNTPKGSYRVSLCKDIRKEATQLLQNYSLEVGDGHKIIIWEDVWCREASLRSSFPSLYEAVGSRGAKMVELWEGIRSRGGWNFIFGRHFNDWEMEEVQ